MLNNKPNSYYTITHSHLRYIPLIERGGFPVKLQDGVQVPADASWAKANQEISQKKADERARATRAGEQVADADIRGNLRVEEELDELLVETNGTLLKPDGEAWGTLVDDGELKALLFSLWGGRRAGEKRGGKEGTVELTFPPFLPFVSLSTSPSSSSRVT